ncbi:DUF2752 domain-containing protein [uncultured Anaerofustis sp.]|uniref:DUF2752 domain-containing protein n=1 Tax=uncultured Anaerofustis sp. TaxID=904996 RepID=UPI002617B426|nr:DUF2752 domain-containing protein [uncultured Anaerofustis sp.]
MKKDIIKKHIPIISVLTIYVIFIYISGIGCPIKYIFDFPCVTCGTTRALMSFLKGDLMLAFYYHPLFLLALPFLLLVAHYNLKSFMGLSKKTRSTLLIIILILYIITYIIRLIFFTIP